jgi:hypothetical protein
MDVVSMARPPQEIGKIVVAVCFKPVHVAVGGRLRDDDDGPVPTAAAQSEGPEFDGYHPERQRTTLRIRPRSPR